MQVSDGTIAGLDAAYDIRFAYNKGATVPVPCNGGPIRAAGRRVGCGTPGPSTSLRGTHDRCFRSNDVSSSTTSRRLSHRPGAAVPRADGVGTGRDRHHPRHRGGHHGRRPPRRHRHRQAHGNRPHPHADVTDSNGEYTAASVPTGTYTVTGEISGFKSVSLSNVQVGVDQRVRADVKLEVGAMTESVEIVAQTPLVQTSQLGPVDDGHRGADQAAAAERPQLRQPDPHDPGRPPRHPRARTSTAPARWRGAPRRRSRPTASVRATTTTCWTASTTTRRGSRRW